MAAKRKPASRKGGGAPAVIWLFAGILLGLGLAWYLWSRGFIPQPSAETVISEEKPPGGEEVAPVVDEPKKSRYDFFTVLPEMEVVVPEQELSRTGQPTETPPSPSDSASYLLQVGSFRDHSDAEQMKARLALMGITARIQTVTVNDATWHRVRVGPVNGARQADDMRNRLSDNGIDSLVMKNP